MSTRECYVKAMYSTFSLPLSLDYLLLLLLLLHANLYLLATVILYRRVHHSSTRHRIRTLLDGNLQKLFHRTQQARMRQHSQLIKGERKEVSGLPKFERASRTCNVLVERIDNVRPYLLSASFAIIKPIKQTNNDPTCSTRKAVLQPSGMMFGTCNRIVPT